MDFSSELWELDSDEIGSITSEDLHEYRPNRWTKAESAWLTLAEEELQLWQSMKKLEGQDLAIHLYNAHQLKRRGMNAATAEDLLVTTVGKIAPPGI